MRTVHLKRIPFEGSIEIFWSVLLRYSGASEGRPCNQDLIQKLEASSAEFGSYEVADVRYCEILPQPSCLQTIDLDSLPRLGIAYYLERAQVALCRRDEKLKTTFLEKHAVELKAMISTLKDMIENRTQAPEALFRFIRAFADERVDERENTDRELCRETSTDSVEEIVAQEAKARLSSEPITINLAQVDEATWKEHLDLLTRAKVRVDEAVQASQGKHPNAPLARAAGLSSELLDNYLTGRPIRTKVNDLATLKVRSDGSLARGVEGKNNAPADPRMWTGIARFMFEEPNTLWRDSDIEIIDGIFILVRGSQQIGVVGGWGFRDLCEKIVTSHYYLEKFRSCMSTYGIPPSFRKILPLTHWSEPATNLIYYPPVIKNLKEFNRYWAYAIIDEAVDLYFQELITDLQELKEAGSPPIKAFEDRTITIEKRALTLLKKMRQGKPSRLLPQFLEWLEPIDEEIADDFDQIKEEFTIDTLLVVINKLRRKASFDELTKGIKVPDMTVELGIEISSKSSRTPLRVILETPEECDV